MLLTDHFPVKINFKPGTFISTTGMRIPKFVMGLSLSFRRHDILMPTEKPSAARQSSEFDGEDPKNKKFATAIVEYGKVVRISNCERQTTQVN